MSYYGRQRAKKLRRKPKLTQPRGSMSLVSRLIDKITIEDQNILRKYGYYNRIGQWLPEHPAFVDYVMLRDIRPPSHMWPHSFERAVCTHLFAFWLIETHPDVAIEIWGCPEQIEHINRAAELSRLAEEYEQSITPIQAERELLTRAAFYSIDDAEGEDTDADDDGGL